MVKKAINSENEGDYSGDDLQTAKSQGEKKGSQTSRNEPKSRMEGVGSKATISTTDNSSNKLK